MVSRFAAQQRHNIAPKKQQHSAERAEMHRNVERQSLITPAECAGNQHEVPGARYWQEFGQALHYGQYDYLYACHAQLLLIILIVKAMPLYRRPQKRSVPPARPS